MLDAFLILAILVLILIFNNDDLNQFQIYIKYGLLIWIILLTLNNKHNCIGGSDSRFKDANYYKNIIKGVLLNNNDANLARSHAIIMPSVPTVKNLIGYLEQSILNIENNKNSKDPNYHVYKDIILEFNKLNSIGNGFLNMFNTDKALTSNQLNEAKHLVAKLNCLVNLWK